MYITDPPLDALFAVKDEFLTVNDTTAALITPPWHPILLIPIVFVIRIAESGYYDSA